MKANYDAILLKKPSQDAAKTVPKDMTRKKRKK